MSQLQKITQWMRDAGQTVDRDNVEQTGLYGSLVAEECAEMMAALGMPRESYELDGVASLMRRIPWGSVDERCINKVEALDAAIDLIWVATGLAASLGADVEGALNEVILSNESKRFEDGKLRKDATGKVIKPTTYRAPRLAQYLPKEAS